VITVFTSVIGEKWISGRVTVKGNCRSFHHFERFVGQYDFRFEKHHGKCRPVSARGVGKTLESDPLLCPNCQTQMKIISVIKEGAVIDKILDHLKYKFEALLLSARPPPVLTSSCESDVSPDPPCWTEGD